MSIVDEVRKTRKEMTLELKYNIVHQLQARKCPVRLDTLMKAAESVVYNCRRYSDLDDAVNELIKEDKIVLHFIGDGELYLSSK
ncbi:MAG: hypothetical protein UY15_C0016G0010 [Parcubacteria group bacterium GW2011_GWA2_47_9]|nr:MAG: hypothetical protein UY15_C0016G0010 [Parcubacteria group bacterium GW2011_GWA2_47_9]